MNDNDPDTFNCECCGRFFPLSTPRFAYSDGVDACAECAPTYEEAQRGFERGAFDDPDAYKYFRERLKNHLGSGGSIADKFFNAPSPPY